MEVLPTVMTSVVTPVFLLAIYVFSGRLNRLEAKVDGLTREVAVMGAELGARIAAVEQWGKRLDRIENEVAALRSDLTQIALAVGARLKPQTG